MATDLLPPILRALYRQTNEYVPADDPHRPPRIGISANRKDAQSCLSDMYVRSVTLAGGAPVIVPVTTDVRALTAVVETLDGLLLSGGGDIDPQFSGEEDIPGLEDVDAYRDSYDFILLRLAYERQIPIFGICRGHQLMNVAFNGTLYQDIHTACPNALQHTMSEQDETATHAVTIADIPSKLNALFSGKKTLQVNSLHHQAVKSLAPEWIITASAPDGIIEAMEHPEYTHFSVQWHPERMAANGNEEMLPLFRFHVRQAQTFATARKYHDSILTVDSHTDTPMLFSETFDFGKKSESKVSLPLMEEGRTDVAFLAAYIPQGECDESSSKAATAYITDRLEQILRLETAYPQRMGIARTPDDCLRLKHEGKKAIIPAIENGYAIGKNPALVKTFKDMGVAYITLCHNGDNDICDSAAGNERWGGLSAFGKEVVAEMNRLGIMVDISHAAESTFYDTLKYSALPIIASHSSVRTLADHRRNLTDEQMKALAAAGGVMQICLYKEFINNIPDEASLSDAIRHILYAIDLMGIDHVGIGSDFDGDGELIGCRATNELMQITMRLIEAGLDRASIEKIWGGNLFRVMRKVQAVTLK